ncbi:hypothetical protein I553_3830 [Mycobacterium xenopi 4042]|uniref:Uncharacterized protein n=1 Tax=Mycobacterium xenopi 4042 TaxID=1299334 RepID=X7YSY2_MYCXE|nr:hypothetical protein I553_3830 [Mycobacterium xenopi 4042]
MTAQAASNSIAETAVSAATGQYSPRRLVSQLQRGPLPV